MDQGVAFGPYQLGNYAFVITDFPAAAFVWAVSLGVARTVFLPLSVAWVGGVVGLLLLVNAGGRLLADESTFAAGGTTGTIIFIVFIFWVAVRRCVGGRIASDFRPPRRRSDVFGVPRTAPARRAR